MPQKLLINKYRGFGAGEEIGHSDSARKDQTHRVAQLHSENEKVLWCQKNVLIFE